MDQSITGKIVQVFFWFLVYHDVIVVPDEMSLTNIPIAETTKKRCNQAFIIDILEFYIYFSGYHRLN